MTEDSAIDATRSNLIDWLTGLRASAGRWRIPLTVAAGVVFFGGVGLSVESLNLVWDKVSLRALLLILLLSPFSLALTSVSLQISARAVGRHIRFRRGLGYSALGSIAELLPLPGGATVRAAALMRAGAGIGESTWIVTVTALLTLAMALVLGSAPLIADNHTMGYVFLAGGAGGTILAIRWIIRRAGLAIATAMVVARLAILALGIARLTVAFGALGVSVGVVEAGLFVVSATLGTAVAIVPAGLGVSEVVAAALASLTEVPPAAAFIAVALNRVLGLCVSGFVALPFVSARALLRP